jgi:ABC-type transport system substrate-binding protein
MLKKLLVFTIFVCVFVSLSACGQQASKKEAGEGEYTPKPEDYIVRVTGSFPLYTDPGVGSNAIEAAALINIYDSLVFASTDGEIQPHVATDWKMSEDGLTYTFSLREGVKIPRWK